MTLRIISNILVVGASLMTLAHGSTGGWPDGGWHHTLTKSAPSALGGHQRPAVPDDGAPPPKRVRNGGYADAAPVDADCEALYALLVGSFGQGLVSPHSAAPTDNSSNSIDLGALVGFGLGTTSSSGSHDIGQSGDQGLPFLPGLDDGGSSVQDDIGPLLGQAVGLGSSFGGDRASAPSQQPPRALTNLSQVGGDAVSRANGRDDNGRYGGFGKKPGKEPTDKDFFSEFQSNNTLSQYLEAMDSQRSHLTSALKLLGKRITDMQHKPEADKKKIFCFFRDNLVLVNRQGFLTSEEVTQVLAQNPELGQISLTEREKEFLLGLFRDPAIGAEKKQKAWPYILASGLLTEQDLGAQGIPVPAPLSADAAADSPKANGVCAKEMLRNQFLEKYGSIPILNRILEELEFKHTIFMHLSPKFLSCTPERQSVLTRLRQLKTRFLDELVSKFSNQEMSEPVEKHIQDMSAQRRLPRVSLEKAHKTQFLEALNKVTDLEDKQKNALLLVACDLFKLEELTQAGIYFPDNLEEAMKQAKDNFRTEVAHEKDQQRQRYEEKQRRSQRFHARLEAARAKERDNSVSAEDRERILSDPRVQAGLLKIQATINLVRSCFSDSRTFGRKLEQEEKRIVDSLISLMVKNGGSLTDGNMQEVLKIHWTFVDQSFCKTLLQSNELDKKPRAIKFFAAGVLSQEDLAAAGITLTDAEVAQAEKARLEATTAAAPVSLAQSPVSGPGQTGSEGLGDLLGTAPQPLPFGGPPQPPTSAPQPTLFGAPGQAFGGSFGAAPQPPLLGVAPQPLPFGAAGQDSSAEADALFRELESLIGS